MPEDLEENRMQFPLSFQATHPKPPARMDQAEFQFYYQCKDSS